LSKDYAESNLTFVLGWTLLIVAALTITTLRAVAGRFLPRPAMATWVRVLLVVLVLCGGFLTIYSFGKLSKAWHRKDWLTASGKVIKSETLLGGTIRPRVIYAFEAGGQAWVDTTDLQVPAFGNKGKQYEVAIDLVKEYPVGKVVQVHYDPNDMANSVLLVNPTWDIYGKIGLGMVLFIGALFFLILPKPRLVI